VGHIRICDFDVLDMSNLNRQILHDKSRVGINKALSAKTTLQTVNANVAVTALQDKITAENVDALVADAKIIVDCMDNFPTRYVLNESAVRKHIPLVYASVWGMDGRLSFIYPPETPCFKCLFSEGPPPGTFPIVGATPGVIGSMQALEVLKYLTGVGTNLKGRQLVWEGSVMTFKTLRMFRDPACPVCGTKKH
jgi:adenylyltransferase/sulfurtransferase